MRVYVNDLKAAFGLLVLCHIAAVSREELFAMAASIGAKLKWFQQRPAVDLPGMGASSQYFDIARSRPCLAVPYDAVETYNYGPIAHAARLAGNQGRLGKVKGLRTERARPRCKGTLL